MQLVLERCLIRPWRLDDAGSLAKHANNRKVWIALRDLFPHPYTIQDAHEFLQRAISEQPTTKFCAEVEGVAAGGIGIRLGQDVNRHTAGLGYWLGEDFWGRGIMTEAVAAFTDFCFDNFPLRPNLCGGVCEQSSFGAHAGEGRFPLEGRLKKNVIKDGKLLDSLLYAKTK
jgi:[ribosomal protein S5]-alanine N-acetyltransferase